MRAVAVETILRHIRMFIQKRPSFVGMALDTGFLDAVLEQTLPGKTTMGRMAVDTEDTSFLQGMMAGHGKLGLGGLMAGKTEFARGERRYL